MLQPILIPSNDKYIEVTIPSAEMFRTKLDLTQPGEEGIFCNPNSI